jgi:copper chaperone CopZ
VKQALEGLAGVRGAVVDRTKKEARVTVEGSAATPAQMVEAIQKAGRFQARHVA